MSVLHSTSQSKSAKVSRKSVYNNRVKEILSKLVTMSRSELVLIQTRIRTLLHKSAEGEKKVLQTSVKSAILRATGNSRISFHRTTERDTMTALQAVDDFQNHYNLKPNRKETLAIHSILCVEAIRELKRQEMEVSGTSVIKMLHNSLTLIDRAFPDYGGEAMRFAIGRKVKRKQ